MKLAICGYTASGKSCQARRLANEFKLEYVSGSDILLQIAGTQSSEVHFWIQGAGIDLRRRRSIDHTIDIRADQAVLGLAREKDDIIFDSWSLPWLYHAKDLFSIYLAANLEARAKMAYGSRDQKPFSLDELKSMIKEKDDHTRGVFLKIYGFDIDDYSMFDLVIDNSALSSEETYQRIVSAVRTRFSIQ